MVSSQPQVVRKPSAAELAEEEGERSERVRYRHNGSRKPTESVGDLREENLHLRAQIEAGDTTLRTAPVVNNIIRSIELGQIQNADELARSVIDASNLELHEAVANGLKKSVIRKLTTRMDGGSRHLAHFIDASASLNRRLPNGHPGQVRDEMWLVHAGVGQLSRDKQYGLMIHIFEPLLTHRQHWFSVPSKLLLAHAYNANGKFPKALSMYDEILEGKHGGTMGEVEHQRVLISKGYLLLSRDSDSAKAHLQTFSVAPKTQARAEYLCLRVFAGDVHGREQARVADELGRLSMDGICDDPKKLGSAIQTLTKRMQRDKETEREGEVGAVKSPEEYRGRRHRRSSRR